MQTGITLSQTQIQLLPKEHSISLMQCLATNDSLGFLEIETNLTVAKSIDGTSLTSLQKVLSKKDIVKAISFFINRFNDNFNAKGKLDDMQIATMSFDLLEVFKYETIEDVMLMFKLARQGQLGDGKDFKLDSQMVFHKLVPAFLELKAIERENQHSKNKNKNNLNTFQWSEEAIKNFEVSHEVVKPNIPSLGERMKEKLNVEIAPDKIIKNRVEYLLEMKAQVRKMTDKQLLEYLLKSDVKSENEPDKIAFDKDVYEMVENEIDSRQK